MVRAKNVFCTYGKKKKKQVVKLYEISMVVKIKKVTNNITNKFYLGNSTSSGDEFDKLMKGPSYQPFQNVSSERSNFFHRQDSATFYNSDVTHTTSSSSSSVGLFKETNDMYCTFASPIFKFTGKTRNRPILKKPMKKTIKKKKVRLSVSYEYKCLAKAATNPNLRVPKDQWPVHVSPILPLSRLRSPLTIGFHSVSSTDMFEENEEKAKRKSNDMSQLAAELLKLGLNSNSPDIKDKTNSRKTIDRSGSKSLIQAEEECIENPDYDILINENSSMSNKQDKSFLEPSKITVRQSKSRSCKQNRVSNKALNLDLLNESSQIQSNEMDSKLEDYDKVQNSFQVSPKRNSENLKDCFKNITNPTLKGPSHQRLSCNKLVSFEKPKDNITKLTRTSNDAPSKAQLSSTLPPTESAVEFVPPNNGSSPQTKQNPFSLGQNLTYSRMSLMPGKLCRRSLLQLKRGGTCSKTIGPEILAQLAQEANMSCTRISSANDILEESLREISEVSETNSPVSELKVTQLKESPTEQEIQQASMFETPPIMKNNPAILSTITTRKWTAIHREMAFTSFDSEKCSSPVLNTDNVDRLSALSQSPDDDDDDASYLNETQNRPSDLFYDSEKFSSPDNVDRLFVLSQSPGNDDASYFKETPNKSADLLHDGPEDIALFTCKDAFLLRCGVEGPTPFGDVFTKESLMNCKKIGEGVYGEVFMFNNNKEKTVLKIIPIEGNKSINGVLQKKFDEVLSELITTEELSLLRENNYNNTAGFCQLRRKMYLKGSYPSELLHLWHEYDLKHKSYNDCPDILGAENCFLALELEHAGEPVESFVFSSAKQVYSMFLQVSFSLAAGELALNFEHRDLHIGNILVNKTKASHIHFIINNEEIKVPSYGIKATIIDFTLSRISFRGGTLFLDLAKDPELFTSTGDYQFEIYRLMREDLFDKWESYQPKTNLRWLHYLLDKILTTIKYRNKNTKVHKDYLKKLENFKSWVQDFESGYDFVYYLTHTFAETSDLRVN